MVAAQPTSPLWFGLFSRQFKMVDKLKGFFLVLLVVLLSAVFALQFGGGQAEGCAAGGGFLSRARLRPDVEQG